MPPPESHDDESQPSAACQTATTGTATRLLNLAVDGVRTYLYTHADDDQTSVCARTTGGPEAGGGRVWLEQSSSFSPVAEVMPGVGPHDSDSPCDLQVVHQETPVVADVHRSGTGENPAALCVTLASDSLSVQVGTEGDPTTPPSVGHALDS